MNGPVDVLAVMKCAAETLVRMEGAGANRELVHAQREALIRASADVDELIAAAHRADGDERPARPERGPGYTDAEWEVFLRGWDAHADAVYASGLRAALARVGGAS